MTIYSSGYIPPRATSGDDQSDHAEVRKFFAHAALFFRYSHEIVMRAEYFFCDLPFAYCSWPYIGGSGPLKLGHLLLGWQLGHLADECLYCGSDLLIFRFGGSPLSGSNSFTGCCIACGALCVLRHLARETFLNRMNFAWSVRKAFRDEIDELHEFEGHKFSWGGTGLVPSRKEKWSTRKLVQPVDLQDLISALQHGQLCPENPPPCFTTEADATDFTSQDLLKTLS